MSTTYDYPGPITLDEFEERSGWTRAVGVKDDGKFTVYTDGTNFVHVYVIELYSGVMGLSFERFGQNNISGLIKSLNLVSEHDEEYAELEWNKHEPVGPDDLSFDVVIYDEDGNDISQFNHVGKDHIFDRMVELMADYGKPGYEVSAMTMLNYEEFYPKGKENADGQHEDSAPKAP